MFYMAKKTIILYGHHQKMNKLFPTIFENLKIYRSTPSMGDFPS